MDDKEKQEVVNALVKRWQKENPAVVEEMGEITTRVALFNAKYGTSLTIASLDVPKPDSKFGIGMLEVTATVDED